MTKSPQFGADAMTDPFVKNPQSFNPGPGLPAWSRASMPSCEPVRENARAFSIPSAMARGDLAPNIPQVRAPAPFPASSPGVPGTPRLPAGPNGNRS
jgi:hypothetical protein